MSARAGWTRVAFGDVVRLTRARSSEPAGDGFERYVGLEHLDPGDLHIRRWGNVSDGTTFTNVFRAGQVLFGKRRAYQRKVAVADFDGICSGDIYVFEPKGDELLSELLPFICQTDRFFEHAVGTSAGSLSPRTNWESLAAFEFALPPIDEQRRLSSALSAMFHVADAHGGAASRAETVASSLLHHVLTGNQRLGELGYDERIGNCTGSLPLIPIGELLTEVQYGISEPANIGGKYRMLRMMDLVDGVAVDSDAYLVDLSHGDLARYRLNPGDVLFNRTNSYELVGRTGVYKLTGTHVFASYLIRLRTDTERLLPDYLCAFLNAPIGRKQVMRFATRGVSQVNVNASNLKSAVIPLPPLEYQQATMERITRLKSVGHASRQRAARARALLSGMVNNAIG